MRDWAGWVGILLCLSQSATLSGLNLAVFSLSRLRLEALAAQGDRHAQRIVRLRRDANFTLVTILMANVSVNVLLTLLAESLMAGVAAFFFSTVVITFGGEILPQAYFTRNALRVVGFLSPLLDFYRTLLWPVARPVATLLDRWVGPEGVPWYRERELRDILLHHARHAGNEVSRLEALGAVNFLALDDIKVCDEGEVLDDRSIIQLPFDDAGPVFPAIRPVPDDPLLRRLHASGKKWALIIDADGTPQCVVDTHRFLRSALLSHERFDPRAACHRPIIVSDPDLPLGALLGRLTVRAEHAGDDVVDDDVIVLWTPAHRRMITGADLLGRLLRGIAEVRGNAGARRASAAPG